MKETVYITGHKNPETKFVLNYFGLEAPLLKESMQYLNCIYNIHNLIYLSIFLGAKIIKLRQIVS